MTHFQSSFIGANGYNLLKKYMKGSTDFSKDFINLLNERADIECSYAKSLAKLSNKITKSGKECVGTLAQAWSTLALQMDAEGDLHKQFGEVLRTELAKPFKTFLEQQIKAQKSIDTPVEKAAKVWNDKKQSMIKIKKNVITKTKECESMSQQIDDSSVKKPLTEKELTKLQSKTKKAETVAIKADGEHIDAVKKLESARHDLEYAVRCTAGQYQNIEEERFVQLKDLIGKLSNHMSILGPNVTEISARVGQAAGLIDSSCDIEVVASTYSTDVTADQILYDSYEEDMKNTMKPDRRRSCIMRKLQSLDQEIYKEQKTKEGIARLSGAYGKTPGYADDGTVDSVTQKIHNADEMIDLLEASKFKLKTALALMDRTAQPVAEIGTHIKTEKDKQGFQNSVLRRQRSNVQPPPYRGPGDGATLSSTTTVDYTPPPKTVAPPPPPAVAPPPPPAVAPPPPTSEVVATSGHQVSAYKPPSYSDTVRPQAIAKYDYEAVEHDELTIRQGDVITVLESMDDGWSKGELNGRIGVFPTSYV
ncbi:nostrin-like [Anneissia japonica]|uniref:nostrin-like n=1 Tax=Anneissia japonica TaxID=1529436 RepID=UPI00142584BE|nr:nostrin-like [Anneissia japonica]